MKWQIFDENCSGMKAKILKSNDYPIDSKGQGIPLRGMNWPWFEIKMLFWLF